MQRNVTEKLESVCANICRLSFICWKGTSTDSTHTLQQTHLHEISQKTNSHCVVCGCYTAAGVPNENICLPRVLHRDVKSPFRTGPELII